MAVYLPQSLLDISKSVYLEIDLTKLTKRQLNNIRKNVERGVMHKWSKSATNIITKYLMLKHHAPHITINSWRLTWENIEKDNTVFDLLTEQVALSKLVKADDGYHRDYRKESFDQIAEACEKRHRYDSLYIYHLEPECVKKLRKEVKVDISKDNGIWEEMEAIVTGQQESIKFDVNELRDL